jgi:ABC-type amino acid transport substrate-binding protein
MTKISKSLCVFVLVACLAFMGVAAVTSIGGANWHIERDQLTGDYTFETTLGETTTYAVKSRQTDEQLTASPKSLAASVIAARKDLVEVQKKKIVALKTETTTFKTQHQMWTALTAADEAAMTDRCDQLASELATLNQQIDDAAKQNIAKVEKTQNTLRTNEARREEVYRLLAQLDEIRTDRFQINEQQKRLRDLLIRKQGVVSRLKRRQVQLVRSGARGQYESDPTAVPAATTKTTQP